MKRAMIFAAACACLLAAGCTRNVDDFNADGTRFEATGIEGDFEKEEAAETAGETAVETESAEAEEETVEETQEYPGGISDEEYFRMAFDRGDVENNGANFVRVGRRVYFLKYEQESFGEPALFGNFLATPSASANGILMYYDLDTQDVTDTVNIIDVEGPLYVSPEGIYMTGHDSEDEQISLYSPDGSRHMNLGEGRVIGVSDDGKYAVVSSYTEDFVRVFSVFDHEKKVVDITAKENENFSYCGMTENGLIYKVYDSEKDINEIRQLGIDGKVTLLGKMLPPEASEEYGAEVVQLLKDEEKLYFNVVYFEGTGHFLAEQTVMSAVDGKKDSLEIMRVKLPEDEAPEYSRLYLKGHTVLAATKIYGDTGLSKGSWGDLVMYDPQSVSMNLIKGFVDDPESDMAKEGMGQTMLQESDVLGGAAFIIAADCERDEESDIGWREAYRLLNLKYLCVPLPGEEGGEGKVLTLADSMQEW